MARELLFSVTKDDCDWTYFKGQGAGGQARNKTSSGARCQHRDSGAVGQCTDSRSQVENKRRAFLRMSETPEFKKWHRWQVLIHNGMAAKIEAEVDQMMDPRYLKVEVVENGDWIEQ